MNQADGEHHCQLLWVGPGSMESSSHAIPSRAKDFRATLGCAWVPVALADSSVHHTDGEHHGQPLCKSSGLMELSMHAIPSREHDLRPRAILGSV